LNYIISTIPLDPQRKTVWLEVVTFTSS